MNKILVFAALVIWTIISIVGICKNISHYSLIDTVVMIIFALSPFIITHWLYNRKRKKVSNEKASVEKSAETLDTKNDDNCNIQQEVSSVLNLKLSSMPQSQLRIHPDLENLIWIGDGPKQNYFPEARNNTVFCNMGITIEFANFLQKEPSALYLSLPVEEGERIENIPRPPYYPRYDILSPSQRFVYLRYLTDPYCEKFAYNVGYAFLLYYGLERHLILGDFDAAFEVIQKLRLVYDNASFQSYSITALVLSSILKNRKDKLEILSKEKQTTIPFEISLLLNYGFGIGLSSAELIEHAGKVGFTNRRYIKMYPDLFRKCLEEILMDTYGVPKLPLPMTTQKMQYPIFANPSFLCEGVCIPDFLHDSIFLGTAFSVLEKTHEKVKLIKAKERKEKKDV